MRGILDIQKQLLPDLLDTMKKRYTILHFIRISGVVGRRTLAGSLNTTERIMRSEVDFLKSQGLLEIESSGIRISETGRQLLEQIEPLVKELFGLTELQEQIRLHFNLKQVVIVPGDSELSPHTKKELGLVGAAILRKHVTQDEVIAVTGGSTMAEVANHLSSSTSLKGCVFVPARGGLGESMDFQANTIASTMAKKTGSRYRLLHVPDQLGEEAYQSLMQDSSILEIIAFIRGARIVIHGIGEAMLMARRRKVDESTTAILQQDGALAEAFGYYFDRDGKILHKMPTVGLRIEDIQEMDCVIGVAGGKSKGEAIAAVLKFGHEDILVTDEAAALEIVQMLHLDGHRPS
ncbi:central glycolytic genes regulator [Paenibacillus sp. 1_12]|uniref:sugar-binding transcriptional regulator n=1 Tax=Paenibacillus sp. 1_12 TaxID=1566278 RepID=UPI0008E36F19|nr:sugar-binding domain-containing protein [Paenibacillus sp. 1_12]SFM24932.1 central glycolytic genes regulator [Paenibacillus sp. 1_12]